MATGALHRDRGARWLWPRALGVVAGLLAVLLALDVVEAAPPNTPSRTIRVGVYENKPKVFTDQDGRAAGIFVELLREMARAEGWELKFFPCQWSECLRALEAGQLDLMPDVAYSRERGERYAFHRIPVLESWSQLYARPGAEIHSLSDVNGKRVAVLADSIQFVAFEQMMRGFGFEVSFVPTKTPEDAFHEVQAGRADVAIVNHLFGESAHGEHGLVQTSVVFQVAELYFATAKARNPELLEAIDRHMEAWRGEPSSVYYTTLNHWMDRPPKSVVPGRVRWLIGIGIGLLLLAVGWVTLLRLQVRARTRHLSRVNEELREAHSALRRSEAVLNAAQRLSRIGGWEWDVEQRVATWTEETYRLHGFAREDFEPGSPEHMEKSLACYDPEARETVREAYRRCVEEGVPYDLEAPFTSATGARLWVRTTAEAEKDASGKVVKVVGNLVDVTERTQAEEQRRKLEEQLRESQRLEAIGKLAGGVAHDFNNLLAVILSTTESALLRAKEAGPVREDLMEIANAGHRAEMLTRQLLAFSRRQVLRLAPVDLNRVATGLEPMLRRIVPEDIDLHLVLAPELPPALADAGQLEQVLMNLVVNARDATPSGGRITLSTADVELAAADSALPPEVEPGRYVLLSVADSGSGMDEQTRTRIFEPFYTTKEPGKGTGLGLATVYGIVRQSGGHIQVDSEPGRGTTFRIYLRHDPSTTSA